MRPISSSVAGRLRRSHNSSIATTSPRRNQSGIDSQVPRRTASAPLRRRLYDDRSYETSLADAPSAENYQHSWSVCCLAREHMRGGDCVPVTIDHSDCASALSPAPSWRRFVRVTTFAENHNLRNDLLMEQSHVCVLLVKPPVDLQAERGQLARQILQSFHDLLESSHSVFQ